MEYKIEIQFTNGWQFISQATFEGCSLIRYRDADSIRVRDKFDGSIIFYGDAYRMLLSEKGNDKLRLACRIYLGGEVIFSGQLQLQGEWWLDENKCMLQIDIDDDYAKILANLDTVIRRRPFNVNSRSLVNVSYREQMQSGSGEFSEYQLDPETWFTGEAFNSATVDDYNPEKTYLKARTLETSGNVRYFSGYKESYCKGGQPYVFFAALRTGQLADPGDINQRDWVAVNGSTDLGTGTGGFPKMGQVTSNMIFNHAILSDYIGPHWAFGTTDSASLVYQADLPTINLKEHLSDAINIVDDSITMGDWDFGELYIYSINDEYFDLKLSEILDIYIMLFNLDWVLENKVFIMKTFTESEPAMPDKTLEYQYINKIFAKDWSSQALRYDLAGKVNKFSLEIDTEAKVIDFDKTIIAYDTFYQNSNNITNNTFVLDIAAATTRDANEIVIIKQDVTGWLINGEGMEELYVYNLGLSVYNLVEDNYKYGRPYNFGVLQLTHGAFKKDIDLIKDYHETFEIKIPYNKQTVLDFGYYLVSKYGNLKINELTIDLSSQSAIIKASKQ